VNPLRGRNIKSTCPVNETPESCQTPLRYGRADIRVMDLAFITNCLYLHNDRTDKNESYCLVQLVR